MRREHCAGSEHDQHSIFVQSSSCSADAKTTIAMHNTIERTSLNAAKTIRSILKLAPTFCFGVAYLAVQAQWTQLATSPYNGGWDKAAFAIDNKVYIGTGWCCGAIPGSYQDDFDVYNTTTGTWSNVAPFGGGLRGAAASFTVNGKGYVVAGSNGTDRKDLWQYDPIQNNWSQKADLPISVNGYNEGIAFSIGSKGYFGTGGVWSSGIQVFSNNLWAYDPATDSWSQRASLPSGGRSMSSAFVIGTDAYVATGYWSNSERELWRYNSITNTWSQRASLPDGAGRYDAIGFAIGGFGYVGLGVWGSDRNDLWRYDPITDSWTQMTSFPGNVRVGASAVVIGNTAYVGHGGVSAGTQSYRDLWSYVPQMDPLSGLVEIAARPFTISPNPVHSTLRISFAHGRAPRQCSLLEATGRVVREYLVSDQRSSTHIDVAAERSGLYVLQVLFADGSLAREQFIKE